ncbi:MAG: TIGR04283 family arsenosugar biosynthesis glycosyltransferase [Pseudomonadota bacterium]|nr:TIGR04283 family arsenosugar biosynthesis glycosyltransferase [Pseudomonadota bacterium]
MLQLSIIIPTLNEAGCIRDILRQLQALRAQGHEVILVDGGSCDETIALAQALVDQLLPAPAGRALQMNVGAQAAAGRVFWFLHADTRVPDKAARLIIEAVQHAGSWGRFDVRLSGDKGLLRLVERMMNWRSRLTGVASGDQGIFVTRELFERVGGFADLPLMEDIDLSRRLKRQQWPVCLRDTLVTSSRRWEQKGILRTIALMWYLRLAYFLGVPAARLAMHYDRTA